MRIKNFDLSEPSRVIQVNIDRNRLIIATMRFVAYGGIVALQEISVCPAETNIA
jgi:hypothetical protein